MIDLGCLPETPFAHLEDSVRALKAEGFAVSVDSIDPRRAAARRARRRRLPAQPDARHAVDRRRSGVHAGADPARAAATRPRWHAAIEAMQRAAGRSWPTAILDPIPFGLTASIVRYQRLRERFAEAPIMMGVGNLTELTEADTSGINALLFGIAARAERRRRC